GTVDGIDVGAEIVNRSVGFGENRAEIGRTVFVFGDLETVGEDFDGHGAGLIASGQTAQAIGDGEEPVFGVQEEGVFVTAPHFADVCASVGFECHGGRWRGG